MENLSVKLLEAKAKINEKARLERLINDAYAEKQVLEKKKQEMKKSFDKEELDVDKLHGVSFSNLIHTLKKDKEDVLQKEMKEALSAKLKYDAAVEELQRIEAEIQTLNSKKFELNNIDNEYKALLDEKEQEMKKNNNPLYADIYNIEEKIAEILRDIKEIEEAKTAGYAVKESLDKALASLSSARDLGVWDMLGGGLLTDIAKHSDIDDARSYITDVQYLLKKFNRELQDVVSAGEISIDIDGFLRFSDFFFDGLFVDWTVQSEINHSIERVENTTYAVDNLINKLETNLKEAQNKIEALNIKKNDLIEKQ